MKTASNPEGCWPCIDAPYLSGCVFAIKSLDFCHDSAYCAYDWGEVEPKAVFEDLANVDHLSIPFTSSMLVTIR